MLAGVKNLSMKDAVEERHEGERGERRDQKIQSLI